VTGAEVAFREVTRAAYDAFVSSPPMIAYRIVAHERDRYYDRSVRYAIRYDTRTGMAHRHDITWGDDADERPFLAAPNLDAVGSFTSRLEYQTVAGHRVLAKATFDQDANLFLNGEQQHGKEHVHFDAVYEAYAFLQPPPDAAPAASKPVR
jgi:hypothetical protein